jgi:hypothetical protein
LLVLPLLFACSPSVKRVETNLVKDVSGGWNDTDAQMVAQEMITDCLQGGWYNRFLTRNGKEPTVIVGTVTNNTMEHINTGVFIEEMQRALINSAKVWILWPPPPNAAKSARNGWSRTNSPPKKPARRSGAKSARTLC